MSREARSMIAAHQASRPSSRSLLLRPAQVQDGQAAVAVHDGLSNAYPNLLYALPRELPALQRLLSGARPDRIEVHHLLDHDTASIQALIASFEGAACDVHVHDDDPRLVLARVLSSSEGAHDRYCGEPDLPDCEDCVADLGHFLHEDISVAALRDRSATFLANARAVVVPSADTGTRMRRHFAGLTPAVVPHENDAAIQDRCGAAAAACAVRTRFASSAASIGLRTSWLRGAAYQLQPAMRRVAALTLSFGWLATAASRRDESGCMATR